MPTGSNKHWVTMVWHVFVSATQCILTKIGGSIFIHVKLKTLTQNTGSATCTPYCLTLHQSDSFLHLGSFPQYSRSWRRVLSQSRDCWRRWWCSRGGRSSQSDWGEGEVSWLSSSASHTGTERSWRTGQIAVLTGTCSPGREWKQQETNHLQIGTL